MEERQEMMKTLLAYGEELADRYTYLTKFNGSISEEEADDLVDRVNEIIANAREMLVANGSLLEEALNVQNKGFACFRALDRLQNRKPCPNIALQISSAISYFANTN